MEEPEAYEEYTEYAKTRPYVTNYEKWSNYKEYHMHHILEWGTFFWANIEN